MKSISPFILILWLLIACGKEPNSLPNESSLIRSASSKSALPDTTGQTVGNTSEGLADQIPISNEQLREWIPEKIGDLEQRKLLVGHKLAMGMSGAIATYQEAISSQKQVSIEVLDGAGSTGAVMLRSIIQKLAPDYEEQLASGYSRIYEREGVRVWEKFNNLYQTSEIEFVLDGRFHFIFKGYQIELEELWSFVKKTRTEMG